LRRSAPHLLRPSASLLASPSSAARVAPSLLTRALSASRGPPHPSESFVQGANSVYMEEMYNSWLQNPASVHKSWDVFFRGVSAGVAPGLGTWLFSIFSGFAGQRSYVLGFPFVAYQPPPNLRGTYTTPVTEGAGAAPSFKEVQKEIQDHLKLQLLVRAYQVSGHHIANLDPLGINQADLSPTPPPELQLETYGFIEKGMKLFPFGTLSSSK